MRIININVKLCLGLHRLLRESLGSIAGTDFLKGRGEKKGNLAHVWFPRGHFSMSFGSQEGNLSCFNQPRGQLSVFCQPRGHFGTLFWLPRTSFSAGFGSQEGTLACVLAPKRAL